MPRVAAWKVLRSGNPTPMRAVDRIANEAGIEGLDRGLLRAMVGSEVRHRGSLRRMVEHFTHGKPSSDLTAHIRLGLVQLFFLDQIPDHAAVSESVRATTGTLGLSKGRYVNAVLRSALRARREGTSGDPRCDLPGRELHLCEPIFSDPSEHLALWVEQALSIPAPLYKRWDKRYGKERALELARAALRAPCLSVRASRCAPDELNAELESQGLHPKASVHPAIRLLETGAAENLIASETFRSGRATLQGATALRAAELVQAGSGDRILDLCAAPGGKTAVLAEAGAEVVACDVDEARLERLAETIERLGLNERVELQPATQVESGSLEDFDAALVDAPCSNTGVLGQRPGARWRFGPATQRSLTALQDELLQRAASCVRPGGRLVYSTCSLEPDENSQRVRAFCATNPSWTIEEELEFLPATRAEEDPIDGGYAARLRHGG